MCVCVCVCVCERERERERESVHIDWFDLFDYSHIKRMGY